jgi:hypothetical protein
MLLSGWVLPNLDQLESLQLCSSASLLPCKQEAELSSAKAKLMMDIS